MLADVANVEDAVTLEPLADVSVAQSGSYVGAGAIESVRVTLWKPVAKYVPEVVEVSTPGKLAWYPPKDDVQTADALASEH